MPSPRRDSAPPARSTPRHESGSGVSTSPEATKKARPDSRPAGGRDDLADPVQGVGKAADDVRPERLEALEQHLWRVERAQARALFQTERAQRRAQELVVPGLAAPGARDLGDAIADPPAQLPVRAQAEEVLEVLLEPGVAQLERLARRAAGHGRDQLLGIEAAGNQPIRRAVAQVLPRADREARGIGGGADVPGMNAVAVEQLAVVGTRS